MIDIEKNLSIEHHDRKIWTLNGNTLPNNLPVEYFQPSIPLKYIHDIRITRENK